MGRAGARAPAQQKVGGLIVRKISNAVDAFCGAVVGVAVGVTAVVVIIQVIFRYFIGFSFSWADELSRYLLVVTTFIGAFSALRHDKFAVIRLLINKLPPLAARVLLILSDILVAFFLVMVIYYGAKLLVSPAILGQVSPALHLPMRYAYATVPLGSLLMLISILTSLWDKIQPVRGEVS